MNIDKARKVALLVNGIGRCEMLLKSLDGRSYEDEFVIYYRGGETCELEPEALNILIAFYKEKRDKLNDELGKLS